MSYSNGGVCLPSPTHVHHVDVSSCVRSLRRSLSRSPSKWNLKSPSLSPSPSSSPKRAVSNPAIFTSSNPPHTPSPLAVPFPPSKLALRSSRSKTTPLGRPTSRRTSPKSPKSPLKRPLSQALDTGNALPVIFGLNGSSSVGQENVKTSAPTERKSFERSRMSYNLDVPGPVNHALSRLCGDGASDNHIASTSSPLKRSDAIMNLDQASLGSPVAKRRSLHGSASFGHDFNVYDHGPTSATPQFEIHDDTNHEYELSATAFTADNSTSSFTSMPRRSSSLRKSTLQQRHGEKTSWGRRHAAMLAQQLTNNQSAEITTPVKNKDRPRLSLDQFMPPLPRDSPFSSQGSLPSASVHVVPTPQPHPLSKTMTTSSSNSSMAEASPTPHPVQVPVNFGDQPRPKLDFTKSLPMGARRPLSNDFSGFTSGAFATPNFKDSKPLPTAFMSTGLLSKVNRNPEDLNRGHNKGNMPDTPCKKHANVFATYPAQIPGSVVAKARHIRHSFGNPSTPFNGQATPTGNFSKGRDVFGSAFNRRGSFLSVDGDDSNSSPDAKGDSQNGMDYDMPPTPTKQVLPLFRSPINTRPLPSSVTINGHGLTAAKKLPRTTSKLNLSTSPNDRYEDESDGSLDMNDSPTTAYARRPVPSSISMPSIGLAGVSNKSHAHSHTLSPQISRSLTSPFLTPSSKPGFAKISHLAPASPLERIDFFERMPPRTPIDTMTPPDPSGLTISNPREPLKLGLSTSMPPPATPTGGRDYFSKLDDRRQSTTPVGNFGPSEVDESLTARFNKVENFAAGEFSLVYRVEQGPSAATPSLFFGESQSRTPPTPLPVQVFAVKKSKKPYQGQGDRQRKLREVNVLKALSHSDYIVHLFDSWESNDHLYIQTDFCEEGGLDAFITKVGLKGRLDDFRIWKMLLETSQGLQAIHDAGFLHLDLKPANILITFSGSLKIADFGMAVEWPAPPGIEGEGDRDYIGPEILEGKFDKPADIFALGMTFLEIAGNVQLPPNGEKWTRLRSGDFMEVPPLSFSSENSVIRDATGLPESIESMDAFISDDEFDTPFGSPTMMKGKHFPLGSNKSMSHDPGNLFGSARRGELQEAPAFMLDIHSEFAMDFLVRWMLAERPEARPTVQQILDFQSVRWVQSRRRAGATVYEGNWGPADEALADDAEMMDV